MQEHFLHVLEDFEVDINYVGSFPTCARKNIKYVGTFPRCVGTFPKRAGRPSRCMNISYMCYKE